MHIAILQFSPVLGAVEQNMARADELLRTANTKGLDLLVLPELAFSGYNHPSLTSIAPHLESSTSGPTATWARRTATRLNCLVCAGYPERATSPSLGPSISTAPTPPPPSSRPPNTLSPSPISSPSDSAIPSIPDDPIGSSHVDDLRAARTAPHAHNYNALLAASPAGALVAHYRKTHLYYTDATWARPSATGFAAVPLALPRDSAHHRHSTGTHASGSKHYSDEQAGETGDGGKVKTAFGICMDLNPYRFAAPWEAYEFATHARDAGAEVVVCCMAWLTRLEGAELGWPAERSEAREKGSEFRGREIEGEVGFRPDGATLLYWVERLQPLVRAEREVVVVLANRCGVEPGEEEGEGEGEGEGGDGNGKGKGGGGRTAEARYAGSSAVMCVGRGRVRMWGVMGRGEEGLLRVDTERKFVWDVEIPGAEEKGEGWE